jgi:cytochrome c oxidase subunit 2
MGILNKLLGIPPVGSEHGHLLDHMLEIVHWFMLFLGLGWGIFIAYALFRFRRKNHPKASYSGVTGNASSHIEIGVIVTEVILLLGFAFPLWATRVDEFPDPDVRVNAFAEQFKWSFQYPGADGKFGMTNRFLMSSANPIGIDPEDPNGLDDIVVPELFLPKGKKVEIAVTAKDVIHNLALVGMRIAQDADPGKVSRMWFVPSAIGDSEIICGQLCGAAHGNMKSLLHVVDQKSYEGWAKDAPKFKDSPFGAEAAKKLGLAPAAATPAAATPPVAAPAPAETPAPAGAPAATPAPAEAEVK